MGPDAHTKEKKVVWLRETSITMGTEAPEKFWLLLLRIFGSYVVAGILAWSQPHHLIPEELPHMLSTIETNLC